MNFAHCKLTSNSAAGRMVPSVLTPLLLILSLCLITLSTPSTGAVPGGDGPLMIVGHTYVAYASDWTPSPQGTLVDVTGEIVSDDHGHVSDLHGNTLTVDSATGTVTNASSETVGLVYQ